tara:strand:+ start:386 stop:544 length:159 start_codon:yes stop_codon:yes gene_type:complete
LIRLIDFRGTFKEGLDTFFEAESYLTGLTGDGSIGATFMIYDAREARFDLVY